MGLLTNRGTSFLQISKPIFSAAITLVEPVFLIIETALILDMVGSLNRWIANQSNARAEHNSDLSSWDSPLTRGAVLARIFVITLTFISYIGAFLLVQQSKDLLEYCSCDVPINFSHTIAALVTLQLIALTATIYKEEGIISESAMVAQVAAIPVFIASWSFHHLKVKESGSR